MNTLFHREFHVARASRDRYQFDQSIFALTGNVLFADFRAAREFAHQMNIQRDLVQHPEQAVRASDLNAMGLIDEILHLVVKEYHAQKNPRAMRLALAWLEEQLGRDAIDVTLRRFTIEFPPLVVYRQELSIDDYLRDNREIALEEMVMLWLANVNPAFAPFVELFDDSTLERDTAYKKIPALLHSFFETQPRFGPDNQNLVDMLRAPALASHTLEGQLNFIRNRWRSLVS